MTEPYDRDADRAQLLEAVLVHVAFDGWSESALSAAAKDTGIPLARALNAFPGGAAEMVAFHSESADRAMIDALMREPLAEMPIRAKVARAIHLRLDANQQHREAIRSALTFLMMPLNGPLAYGCFIRPSMRSGMRSAIDRRISASTPSAACWRRSIRERCSIG